MADLDLRLDPGFWTHWKTALLVEHAGLKAAVAFQELWGHCAAGASKNYALSQGDLTGMPDRVIELVAKWRGRRGRLVAALVAAEYLHGDEGERYIHEWPTHQPYIARAFERREQALKASEAARRKRLSEGN